MGYFRFPRLTVLQGIYDSLADVSETRFVTSRPGAIPDDVPHYIVIRMASGIRDKGDTYQTSKVLLHLFVRDRKGGIENTWLLEKMQSAMCDKFPLIHERFTASDPNIIGGGEDAGFHSLVIQLTITINKKTI